MIYIKKFENNAAYAAYTASTDFITPNVSYIEGENKVKMTPKETRVVAKLTIYDDELSEEIRISSAEVEPENLFSEIEIDGVVLPSLVSTYVFSTTGEHTIKYRLLDPKILSYWAFYECDKLSSISIPNSVTYIRDAAFSWCRSLSSVTIPSGVTNIGRNAFEYCSSLTSITIPNSLVCINARTFQDCSNLTNIVIPNSVTSIEEGAFESCNSLLSVTIPSSVTKIGEGALGYCDSLSNVTICDGVANIEDYAFRGCGNLSSVMIPDSVTTIGEDVFNMYDYYGGEAQLTSCTIGSGVTYIGGSDDFFGNCNNLQSFTIYATTPPELGNPFEFPDDATIYVPAESVDAYKAADVWSDYEDRILAIP